MRKKIFLIAGRTASGKSTVAREVCKNLGLKQVKSYTTRPPRPEEEADPEYADHLFITEEDMKAYQGDIAAYTKIGDHHYFTTRGILDESDVYVIDPKGIRDLKERCREDYDFVVIYLNQPSYEIARERYGSRGGSRAEFEKRWTAEEEQFDDFETQGSWDYSFYTAGQFPKIVSRKVESVIQRELAPVPDRLFTLSRSDLEGIFADYISRRRDERKETPGTYNEAWVSGEIHEMERWLSRFGVDLSYETIEPMIDGTKHVQMILKNKDKRKGEN